MVIAIISILAALLMPSLKKAKDAAKSAACMSNLRQIGLAITAYAGDNSDRIPALVYYTGASYANGKDSPWDWVILPYLNLSTNMSLHQDYGVFKCPLDIAPRYFGANSPNSYNLNDSRGAPSSPEDPRSPAGKQLGAITRPAEVVLVFCGNTIWSRLLSTDRPIVALTSRNGYGYYTLHWSPVGDTTGLFLDHNKGSNYLMVDGHVEWLPNSAMLGYYQGTFGDKPSQSRWLFQW